jgi:hypothetical protein
MVPYSLAFGAAVMRELTAKAPEAPPPSQTSVDQIQMSRCPLVVVDGELRVRAARCGHRAGSWVSSPTRRNVARWRPNREGGIDLTIDSAVSGPGSVEYASLQRAWSLDKTIWRLPSCQAVDRYLVEESVIKLLSDVRDQQDGKYSYKIYYKYTLKHPNGTDVAETSLFTSDMSRITLSAVGDEVTAPIAIATREGDWRGAGWTLCTDEPREWRLAFPDPEVPSNANPIAPRGSLVLHDYSLANVQDLRVAAAALFTLAAWRQEDLGEGGIPRQGNVWWTPSLPRAQGRVLMAVTITLIVLCCCCSKEAWFMLRGDFYEFFARLESEMPRRSAWRRKEIMYPTWWI